MDIFLTPLKTLPLSNSLHRLQLYIAVVHGEFEEAKWKALSAILQDTKKSSTLTIHVYLYVWLVGTHMEVQPVRDITDSIQEVLGKKGSSIESAVSLGILITSELGCWTNYLFSQCSLMLGLLLYIKHR